MPQTALGQLWTSDQPLTIIPMSKRKEASYMSMLPLTLDLHVVVVVVVSGFDQHPSRR